ncbi:hypothetical protein EJ02DRAFT_424869 [Clathrospora elynae]|uniref:Heterokaryon incompatibility domain-containing protein n=1 Tax=Clathrospora elynae TaxID=706981 RepID=A0A6A5SFG6_9PLEO|nr:hypothetical protein EJ02DRAFT_424869 [Clathrospora elynae]
MRLLHIESDGTFSLGEFIGDDIPPYTVLSHMWGADKQEVTYQDLFGGTGQQKSGWGKIRFLCQADDGGRSGMRMGRHMLQVSLINKSSITELAESINFMFKWYKDAVVCYILLEDPTPDIAPANGFQDCRWFTRG